jgi:hypothetical protein
MCIGTELWVSSIRLPAFGANTCNGTFQQAKAIHHSSMDQSPRVEPLTILLSAGDGLTQTVLLPYKGTISNRKPCIICTENENYGSHGRFCVTAQLARVRL